jgi:hypothetical protein
MGKLIKQAIADETKIGHACKPYVEKKMMGKQAQMRSVLVNAVQ